jgi:hypothetical protein
MGVLRWIGQIFSCGRGDLVLINPVTALSVFACFIQAKAQKFKIEYLTASSILRN